MDSGVDFIIDHPSTVIPTLQAYWISHFNAKRLLEHLTQFPFR